MPEGFALIAVSSIAEQEELVNDNLLCAQIIKGTRYEPGYTQRSNTESR